ncbi:glycolate oxidase iron-sulfur subunit [Sphingomonas jinjuensis]|uniref:Glycolate oxidase iron-sulfur subunit n=1 Tax=Sphingomonas jinjuensis TaxID=535907 RepID=A0A840F7B1_9SPHN|nr:glycolate oxidase subunit GlcF [Sphingomonas jinjuensis]MBB4152206.1 glycolate oxidase iron-sulfur subunit [Sphingomonas jinjuensis]
MKTSFTAEQLADPATATAAGAIRTCVHCSFCTATCPTYVLLGDELDSPRGRISLMKDMLENERVPSAVEVKHIDRCLSCLACTTTCPSGVDYMHLVDHARAYIAERYRRPLGDRMMRWMLATVLPHPRRFRLALRLAAVGRLGAPLLGKGRLAAMLAMAPTRLATPVAVPRSDASGKRVVLLRGCAEPVLKPAYQAAAARVLGRLGYAVVPAPGEACCGALVHHLGHEAEALASARRNVDAWTRVIEDGGLDAILVTASGCGTTIKDYGHLLRGDPDYAAKAARVSALAKDISELLADADLPASAAPALTVAYHGACSLQHGQKVTEAPKRLLARMGFAVRVPAEAHLCCGSAGTYNILQPAIADRLGERKAAALDRLGADVIATGNIGCAMQIGRRSAVPVVHVVELVDWAMGGPRPSVLA